MFFLVFRIVASPLFTSLFCDPDSCLQLLPEPTPTPAGDVGETSLRFVKELKDGNVKGRSQRMEIPKEFAVSTGIAESNLIQLEDERGQKWPISVTMRDNGSRYSMISGWHAFHKGNNLQNGNILLFESVPGSSVVKVSVMEEGAGRELLAQASRGGFLGRSRSFRFVKELKDYHYCRGGNLLLPRGFAEGTGMATSNHIVIDLEDERRRKWPVSLTNRKNSGRYSICGGWPAFLNGNNLQIGTILLFEFVPNSDNVVKVTAMEERDGRALLAQAGRGGLL